MSLWESADGSLLGVTGANNCVGGREGGGSKISLYCYKTVGTLVLSVLLVLLVW